MNPTTQSLLNELYAADASLKRHESTLVSLIERMLQARPNVKIDARFRAELRAKLLEAIAERETRKERAGSRRLVWALTGALACLIIAVPVVYTLLNKPSAKLTNTAVTLGSRGKTKQLSANAFGSLTPDRVRLTQAGETGGGGQESASASDKSRQDAIVSETTVDQPAPVDYDVNVFNYTGADLALPTGDLTVSKREKGFSDVGGMNNLLRGVRTDLVDLSKLSQPELQNLSFVEDRDRGYQIFLDLVDGSVSIQENWVRWPSLMKSAELSPLTTEDVPAESELIAIANRFLADYGISRSAYGQPVVQNPGTYLIAQEDRIESAAPDGLAYVPDTITVVYPLMINGTVVNDLGGLPYGLNVRINVRERRVSGADNLRSLNLATSAYAPVSDPTELLKIVKRGGVYGTPIEGATSTSNYEVGTPELVLTVMQTYAENESDEYFVPAFRFPITKSPENQPYWQTAIVVPLIQDFLDETGAGEVEVFPGGAGEGGGTAPGSAGQAEDEAILTEPVETPVEIVNGTTE